MVRNGRKGRFHTCSNCFLVFSQKPDECPVCDGDEFQKVYNQHSVDESHDQLQRELERHGL